MLPDSDYHQMLSMIHQARVAVKQDFKTLLSLLVFRSKHEKCGVKNHINNGRTRDDRWSVVIYGARRFENDFFSEKSLVRLWIREL